MHSTYTVMSARYHLGRWAELDVPVSQHLEALAQEPNIGCPYTRGGPVVAALALAHQGRLGRAAELAATLTSDLEKPGLPEALLARYLVASGDPRAGRELAGRIVGRWLYAEQNASEALALIGPASDRGKGWLARRAETVRRRSRSFGGRGVPAAHGSVGRLRAAGGRTARRAPAHGRLDVSRWAVAPGLDLGLHRFA